MAENKFWNAIRNFGSNLLDNRDEKMEQRAAQQAAPVSQTPVYRDNSVVQVTSQAAPGRMGSGLYQYNSGVQSTKGNTGFSSNHEFEQQYQYARQLGLSKDQAYQQLAAGTRWKEIALGENGRPIVSYETGVRSTKDNPGFASNDEFRQQYQLAVASGLSKDEAYSALANGTRWREQGEDLWDNREYQQSVDDRSFLSKAIGAMTWLPSLTGDMEKIAARYQDTQDDTFWGQSIANFKLGLLQQRAALLTGRALMKGDEDMYNQALEFTKLAEEYASRNAIALDDENAVATWLSKDIAQYLPQLMMQTESSALPSALFGGIGVILGGLPGLTAGLKAGGVAGSTAYSYATMLGNAFTDLTTDGVDPTVAVKLAKDEALISSIIEGADTAKDLFLGVYSSLGFGEKAFDLSSDLASRLLKGIKGWAGNVGEEGLEEILQEIVTQANASRAARGDTSGGILGLLRECGYIAAQRGIELGDHFFNGAEWSDALKELGEAGRGGAVVGAVMGGLGTTHSIINETRQVNAMNRGFDQMASDPDHKVTTIDGKQVKTTEISDEELARQLRNAEGLKHQDAVDILQAERERRNAAAAAKTQNESMWGDDEETAESASEAATEAAPAEAAPVEATAETKTEAPAAPGEAAAASQTVPSAPTEAAAPVSAAPGTPADQVRTMLSQPLNRSQANKIINDPELRAAYEQLTGEKLPASKSEAAKAVMARSQNQAAPIATNPAPVYDSNGQPITNNTKGAAPNDSNRGNSNANPGNSAGQAGAGVGASSVRGVPSGTVSPVGQEQSGNGGVDSQSEGRGTGNPQNEERTSGNPEAGQKNRGSESVQESVSGENPEGEQASSASNETGNGQNVSASETVKKKSEKSKKAERRLLAAQRHFGFASLRNNPVKNIQNAKQYYDFVVKAVGKAINSENFAQNLISKRAQEQRVEAIVNLHASDSMSSKQRDAFTLAISADIVFNEFLNGDIDAQALADELDISLDAAKKRMDGFDKRLLDSMVDEKILDSEYNVRGNPFAREDAKRVIHSGEKNTVSVLAEGQKVGKSQTVDSTRKYAQMPGDKEIHEGVNGRKVYQRGGEFLVVDADGFVIGDAKEKSTAYAKANNTSSTYEQLSIKLGDKSLIQSESTGALVLDQEAAFSDQNNLTTVQRSKASDIVNAQYEKDGHRKIDTSIIDIELKRPDYETMSEEESNRTYNNLTNQIQALIAGSNYGIHGVKGTKNSPGITTKAGVSYKFFGMTSSGAKDLRVKMVRSEVYDKLRRASLSGLTEGDIKKFNVAKYITASSSIFTPSNADTGVKISETIILPDIYNLLQSVTRDFMMLDDKVDRKGLHDMFKAVQVAKGVDNETAEKEANRLTDEFVKKGKVGYTQELISDILLNVTDGTGFIMSDKGESFQMRALGGFKGQLVGFDFFGFLNDHVPVDENSKQVYQWYGEDGKLVGGIRRWANKGGVVELCDKWGTWQKVTGKKAVLFDSCVKFAGQFKSFNDMIERPLETAKKVVDGKEVEVATKTVGDEDLRSIPRENVYGAHLDAGYLEGYETFGMSQFLRGQRNFSDDLVAAVMDEKIDKVLLNIKNNPTAAAKLFGVDLNSKTPPASSDNRALIIYDAWKHGENLLRDTAEGQSWLSDMMGKVVEDFRGGKMAFEKGTANYQWVDPDVVGLFNAMTSVATEGQGRTLGGLFVNGYSGLQNGEILNMNLKEGDTAVGRFPALSGRGVQVRTNIRNEIYSELVEKYGLDPNNTYISVNDTLSKYLDNDYDGDPVVSFQGALMELVKDARSKSNNKYIEFAHAKADPKYIKPGAILACVKAYIDADKKYNIGQFDNMLERLYAIPDKDLEKAAKAYGKEHGLNLDKESFISLLEARFGVAYVLSIDYAKTGQTYKEFYNLVSETNDMIYKIAESNNYFATKEQKDTFLKDQKQAERYGKRLVPATWEFSKKEKKRNKWRGAEERNRNYRGDNALAALVFNSRLPEKTETNFGEYGAKTWKATFEGFLGKLSKRQRQEGRNIRQRVYGRAMSRDPASFGNLDQRMFTAVAARYSQIVGETLDPKKFKNEADIIREKKRLIYEEIQKKLGLNNRQFTDLMLYVLGPRNGNTAMILDFDQNVIDPSNHELSTKQIIGENLRLQSEFEFVENGISAAEDSMNDIKSAMESTEKKIADLQKEMKTASANVFLRASNVVNAVKAKIGQVENRLNKLRNKNFGRMSTDDVQVTQELIESARRELASLRKQLATAETNAFSNSELEKEVSEVLEPLERELRNTLRTMGELEQANEYLENYFNKQVSRLERANAQAETQYAEELSGFEDVSAEDVASTLGIPIELLTSQEKEENNASRAVGIPDSESEREGVYGESNSGYAPGESEGSVGERAEGGVSEEGGISESGRETGKVTQAQKAADSLAKEADEKIDNSTGKDPIVLMDDGNGRTDSVVFDMQEEKIVTVDGDRVTLGNEAVAFKFSNGSVAYDRLAKGDHIIAKSEMTDRQRHTQEFLRKFGLHIVYTTGPFYENTKAGWMPLGGFACTKAGLGGRRYIFFDVNDRNTSRHEVTHGCISWIKGDTQQAYVMAKTISNLINSGFLTFDQYEKAVGEIYSLYRRAGQPGFYSSSLPVAPVYFLQKLVGRGSFPNIDSMAEYEKLALSQISAVNNEFLAQFLGGEDAYGTMPYMSRDFSEAIRAQNKKATGVIREFLADCFGDSVLEEDASSFVEYFGENNPALDEVSRFANIQSENSVAEETQTEQAEQASQFDTIMGSNTERSASAKKNARRIAKFAEKYAASFEGDKSSGRADRAIIRFGKVVSRFAEGKATVAEVASAYQALRGTQYYDDTPGALITEKFNELSDLYEDSGFGDGTTPSPETLDKLSRVADEAFGAFVARGKLIEKVNRINNSLAEQAKNQKPAAKLAGKIMSALGSWQVNAPTFFKMLSKFQQNSTGYQMADRIYQAVEQEQRYVVNALNELKDVSQMKGYSDLISGKTKVTVETLGIEMKAIDAVNLLRTLDTLEYTKGATASALSFVDSDGIKHSLYSKSGHSIAGDVRYELTGMFEFEGADPILAEYYKAASNVFATFSADVKIVTEDVNGFSPEMINPGWYSPVIWGENAEAAENFNALESELKGAPGYTMRRSADSHGTLYIGSMQDVLSSYITRMSEYLSYAELRAELAAMNQNVENRGSETLATITGNALGKDYARFINNYIKDMTMTKAQDPTLLSSLRNLMQKGVLIGSPSVMMKQSASYWNAAPIISMESLVKARGLRGIQKNAGVGKSAALDYRSMTGKFDPTVSELFSNNNTFADKLAAKSKAFNLFKNGIGLIDHRTVNNIYIAACYDVEKRGLKRGTAEFDSAVDELFTRAVTVTQPMFQKALRAENARTSNELVRMLSMFRTQQTQNYNRVVTALGEYATTKDAAHKKALQGTIKGQLTSAVSLAVMTGIADMLLHKLKKYRDDEDKEKIDPGKVASRMALNSIEALAGTYWFGSELSKIAIDVLSGGETNEFYSPSFGALSTITDSISALKDFAAEPSVYGAKKFVGYASQLGGIPLNNVYNLLNSVVMYAKDMAGTNPEYYDDILRYIDNAQKLDNRFARAAASGDAEKTNTLFNAMARQYGDKADDQVRSVVKNQYNQGNMSANQAANLLIQYGELDSDKAVQRVARWDFMAEYPQYEDMSESAVADWNTYIKPAGIPVGTWYSINNWFNNTNSIKDANGKVVTSKQELVIDYLSELDMTSSQKDALWLAFGYKTTTAAYRARPWR